MAYIVGTFLLTLLVLAKFKWFIVIGLIVIYLFERGVI